jgi:hypothetical protein
MNSVRLTQRLEPHGPATAFVLSDEQVARLSTKKAFPVLVEVGGRTARLRLARMGGLNMIGLSKAVRTELGVDIGDTVEALVSPDEAERTVEVPEVLATALAADSSAAAAFEALSFTARKEMARSIAEAKQEATRERRLAKALEALGGKG